MSPFDLVLCISFAVLAVVFFVLGLPAFRHAHRVAASPTNTIQSLQAGVHAEILATVQPQSKPLRSMRGEAVCARWRQIVVMVRRGNQRLESKTALDKLEMVPSVATDTAESTCGLTPEFVLLLGDVFEAEYTYDEFLTQFADVWAPYQEIYEARRVSAIRVKETTIAEGARCMILGQTLPDESIATEGDGYRGVRAGVRLTGTSRAPLILSTWSESKLIQHLRRPGVLFWMAAVGCLQFSVLVWMTASILNSLRK